jgi:transcriptional regulator with XRE-family HTH domain
MAIGDNFMTLRRMGVITPTEFKEQLRAAGWTQARLAEALGYKQSWVSKIIHGARHMNCDVLYKICRLTGISPAAILGLGEDETKSHGDGPENIDESIFRELATILSPAQRKKFIEVLGKIK